MKLTRVDQYHRRAYCSRMYHLWLLPLLACKLSSRFRYLCQQKTTAIRYDMIRWLGTLVVRASNSQHDGGEFASSPSCCGVTTLSKLFTPICLSAGRSRLVVACLAVVFITTSNAIYNLRHRLHTLPAVPRSTHPSTLCRMINLTLPYLTFGMGGYQPPSAEAITGLAKCTSPK